jgi:hypothetical protein
MQSEKNIFNLSKSDCSFIGASIFVSFFVLWFLWKVLELPSIFALLAMDDAAAWVQAIGSLILVGVTVFLFFAGESRRNIEKDAERKIDIDKAKLFLLQNGNVFGEIEVFSKLNQIHYYDDSRRGEGSNLFYYPALDYFYVEYESIKKLCWEFEVFMQMQVPIGVPELCVPYVFEQQKIIRQISNFVREDRKAINDLLRLKASRKRSFENYELLWVAEIDYEFSCSIPMLKKLINELKLSYEKMEHEIFSR